MTNSFLFGIITVSNRRCPQRRAKIPQRGGERARAEIKVKENETIDSALRRFKRSYLKSGVQAELRKREHYEKPSVKRKKKSEAARKRKYR